MRDTDPEYDLAANILRFPEQYPRSIGGLRRDVEPADHRDRADQPFSLLPDEPNLGVHALDDGRDTFFEEGFDEGPGGEFLRRMIVSDL